MIFLIFLFNFNVNTKKFKSIGWNKELFLTFHTLKNRLKIKLAGNERREKFTKYRLMRKKKLKDKQALL